MTLCYSISTTEYRSGKLTIIMLDPPNSNNQLGSETITINSYSKCTDARRIQQESSAIGYSSSEKSSYKGGKWWMASAIEVLTNHTHSNISDENGHPRKSNKSRWKQLIGQTTRPAQEMTRQKLWIKLKVRVDRAEIWRLTDSHMDREMTAQNTYTTKQKTSSIKQCDRRDDEPLSERDARKSKSQKQRRKAGTT